MAFSYYNQQYADTSLQFLTTQKEISTVAIHDWEFVVFLVVFFFFYTFQPTANSLDSTNLR